MASLVRAFAASHGPLIVREWQRVPAEQKSHMSAAYRELGRRLMAAKPDVGRSNPSSILRVVVFPAPFGPRRP